MSKAQEIVATVARERYTEKKVRAKDTPELVQWIHELEDEVDSLALLVVEAFQEGWYSGRGTTSVCGHGPDWEDSEVKEVLDGD